MEWVRLESFGMYWISMHAKGSPSQTKRGCCPGRVKPIHIHPIVFFVLIFQCLYHFYYCHRFPRLLGSPIRYSCGLGLDFELNGIWVDSFERDPGCRIPYLTRPGNRLCGSGKPWKKRFPICQAWHSDCAAVLREEGGPPRGVGGGERRFRDSV